MSDRILIPAVEKLRALLEGREVLRSQGLRAYASLCLTESQIADECPALLSEHDRLAEENGKLIYTNNVLARGHLRMREGLQEIERRAEGWPGGIREPLLALCRAALGEE